MVKEGTTRVLGSAGFIFMGMVCSMSLLYFSSFWVAQGQGGERCGWYVLLSALLAFLLCL